MTTQLPEINRELFQKIHDQITQHPEAHNQHSYESKCGTTRCVAGWALHFHNPTQDIAETAQELSPGPMAPYSEAAAKLLGLTPSEAEWLFLYAEGHQAREVVELYALKGRRWQENPQ